MELKNVIKGKFRLIVAKTITTICREKQSNHQKFQTQKRNENKYRSLTTMWGNFCNSFQSEFREKLSLMKTPLSCLLPARLGHGLILDCWTNSFRMAKKSQPILPATMALHPPKRKTRSYSWTDREQTHLKVYHVWQQPQQIGRWNKKKESSDHGKKFIYLSCIRQISIRLKDVKLKPGQDAFSCKNRGVNASWGVKLQLM